eukprot:13621920-Heterocapsa_arctica.AAC.1
MPGVSESVRNHSPGLRGEKTILYNTVAILAQAILAQARYLAQITTIVSKGLRPRPPAMWNWEQSEKKKFE